MRRNRAQIYDYCICFWYVLQGIYMQHVSFLCPGTKTATAADRQDPPQTHSFSSHPSPLYPLSVLNPLPPVSSLVPGTLSAQLCRCCFCSMKRLSGQLYRHRFSAPMMFSLPMRTKQVLMCVFPRRASEASLRSV